MRLAPSPLYPNSVHFFFPSRSFFTSSALYFSYFPSPIFSIINPPLIFSELFSLNFTPFSPPFTSSLSFFSQLFSSLLTRPSFLLDPELHSTFTLFHLSLQLCSLSFSFPSFFFSSSSPAFSINSFLISLTPNFTLFPLPSIILFKTSDVIVFYNRRYFYFLKGGVVSSSRTNKSTLYLYFPSLPPPVRLKP